MSYNLIKFASNCIVKPLIAMSAKVAVDLKLFQYIVAKDGPITATELAKLSGAEELLISLFLSILTGRQMNAESAV
jgi:hypothetical protein